MANSQPPPNANPFTQAIIGFGQFSILKKVSCPALAIAILCSFVKLGNSLISAPATKALGPVPVMITDLMLVLANTSSSAKFKSAKTC